tara:strand:+ start:44 stop:913 length:870 start_codon:yes stop_codon:yes gene_type:complete
MPHRVLPPSILPICASGALLILALGIIGVLQRQPYAWYQLAFGLLSLTVVIIVWFLCAIDDARVLDARMQKRSDAMYRWSMFWFIFSEVWFFAALFGILWYARVVSVPTLAGDYVGDRLTHYLLWPSFDYQWPLLAVPDPSRYQGPVATISLWGLPLINTVILLTSGVTITIAHWALLQGSRLGALCWQLVTCVLGCAFLYCQYIEYVEAHQHLGLTLSSGIFGSVFYFLTGFHGLHVALGTLMLLGISLRIGFNHFTPSSHLAFEVVSWYWHFVDVVWLLLFIFVYWL